MDKRKKIEWAVAVVLTAATIALHIRFYLHAGALWQDEVTSLNIAREPSLTELWQSLHYESFPPLFNLVLRVWTGFGAADSDVTLRFLGLLIGVLTLLSLWFAVIWRSGEAPLCALAFSCINPLSVITTDSLRPYGLGVILMILLLAFVMRILENPRPIFFIAAAFVSVLGVQTLYQNAVLLAGMLLSGAVALIFTGGKKMTAVSLLLVGAVAAFSLLPEWPLIRLAESWNIVAKSPFPWTHLKNVVLGSMNESSGFASYLWFAASAVVLVIAWTNIRSRTTTGEFGNYDKMISIFSASALVLVTSFFLIFIRLMEVPPHRRYFIPLLVIISILIDHALLSHQTLRKWRAACAIPIFVLAFPAAWFGVDFKQTNIDLISEFLNREATSEDLILVSPWGCGVSFERYYRGRAEWTTVPKIRTHRQHRIDLFKEKMALDDPLEEILKEVQERLARGGTVWLVRSLTLPSNTSRGIPRRLRPAPQEKSGWYVVPYLINYQERLDFFLMNFSLDKETIDLPVLGTVNPYENLRLEKYRGDKPF